MFRNVVATLIILAFGCSDSHELAPRKPVTKPAQVVVIPDEPEPEPEPWKLNPQKIEEDLIDAIDMVKTEEGMEQIWAKVILAEDPGGKPVFHDFDFRRTARLNNWYPASSIKLYVIVAALTKLKRLGWSIRTEATFSTCLDYVDGECLEWDEDEENTVTRSFREMIKRTVTCSSNLDYTLLLRFVGIDEMNERFLTPSNGFFNTAISKGYAGKRTPKYIYNPEIAQRFDLEYRGKTASFSHMWNGVSYAQQKSCIYHLSENDEHGNCTSANDFTEFMKRLMFHNRLPESKRFDIRKKDRKWLVDTAMNNNDFTPSWRDNHCGSAGWDGVKQEMPGAYFRHKGGYVRHWRSDIQYVCAPDGEYCYIALLSIHKIEDKKVKKEDRTKLSPEMARFTAEVARVIKSAYEKTPTK